MPIYQSEDIENCLKLCWQCRDTCQNTLFNHCLKVGGKHTEEKHVKIMMGCIEICQVAADFMRQGSPLHKITCAACAKICEECAKSCEQIRGTEMKQCAEICRRCAESCLEMSEEAAVA